MSAECVLLVDSDFDSRNVYKAILLPNGHPVVEATDGEEALGLAADVSPKIIISELVLPRLNGLDLLARLKESPRTASIPFVFLAATESVEHRRRARSLGCTTWLLKPRTPSEILELVNALSDSTEAPSRPSAPRRPAPAQR